MSTQAFQKFLKQLDARDYAKADGFDLNWYDQMGPAELKEAEKLLLAQAHTGDMSPIPSLAKIATPAAVAFLKQTFEAKNYHPESGLDYELAKYLWDLTGDETYLRVFDELILNNTNKRLRVIHLLSCLPDTGKRIHQLLMISKTDSDRVNRFQAAKEILILAGVLKENTSNLEDFRPLLNKISSENKQEKADGQAELSTLLRHIP
ncbi:MAG TPA: hypothetical protein VF598_07315 [Hymenobacter sp.]|jgi:hypothetical protein